MDKTVTLDVAPNVDAEYESTIDLYLGEVKLLQARMKEDQREIETLRAETDAILTDIMQTLKAA